MTVTTETNVALFVGSGVADEFDYAFHVLDSTHLLVEQLSATTGLVTKTYTAGEYTVSGVGTNAGSVTLLAGALSADYHLRVTRTVPYTQELDIVNQGGFYPETVEEQLDLTVMGLQQVGEIAGRALVVPPGEAGFTLSQASDRAGKFLVFDAGGDLTETAGMGSDGALRTDLAGSGGAALVGNANGGTLQTFCDKFEVVALGALAAGTTANFLYEKSFSGHSGGTTDFRGWVDKVTASGSNAIAQVNARNVQVELTATGTVTASFGTQAYIRAGLGGVGAVNVTSMRVYDGHVANEGTGPVGTATIYFGDGVDLIDGSGTIGTMMAFYAGNQSHATRVTVAAIGFNCGDMTAGPPLVAAFRSQMTSGTGKYAIYSDGNAQSLHAGKIAIGSGTAPTDMVEIRNGYLKATASTDFLASGSYHELRSANEGEFVAKITSKAVNPKGLHIKFTVASGLTGGHFLLCDDAGTTRASILRNGTFESATNSYGGVSNRLVKHSIEEAPSLWEAWKQMRFHTYLLNDNEAAGRQFGALTDEVKAIFPELVYGEGRNEALNYSGLAVRTGHVVVEVIERLETVENEVRLLKAA